MSEVPLNWQHYYLGSELLSIGDSLFVERGDYTYPFRSNKILPGGEKIKRGDPIMYLHVHHPPSSSEGHIAYLKRVRSMFLSDLAVLSVLTRHEDFKGIKAFLGISHLSKMAQKYGFETFPVPNKKVKRKYKNRCLDTLDELFPSTGYFNRARVLNFKDPEVAAITPRRLHELYFPFKV